MSAVEDLRAMVDRLTKFVGEHYLDWEKPGTAGRLMVDAASLMTGVANALDRFEFDLERKDTTKDPE